MLQIPVAIPDPLGRKVIGMIRSNEVNKTCFSRNACMLWLLELV